MIRFSVYLTAATAAAAAVCGPAQSQTLMDALAAAYDTNPTLEAQRAQLRATDEQLAQVRALILPNITGNASIGRSHTEGLSIFEFGTGEPVETPIPGRTSEPKTYSLTVSQPLFDGGAFGAGRRQVQANIGQQEEVLRATEQSVLLDAVSAYMDVLRAGRVVEIRISNVDVLIDEQRAAGNRFDLGEVTRTDVAQADSRLALARAELITAQSTLQQQRAAFARIVGFPPGTLAPPPDLPAMPDTLDTAINTALGLNPQLIAASFAEEAAQRSVGVAKSDLWPDVTLDGSLNRREDTSFTGDYTDSYSVTATLRVPLFTGGRERSEVREAKQLATRARHQLDQTRRETVEQVTAAWSSWVAAREVVVSAQSAVEATDLAAEGVGREAEVGLRTTLDALNAEQEALTARVTLAGAERDSYVAAHQLLAAMGMLNVEYLDIPVARYDPRAYLDDVVNDWPENLISTSTEQDDD